MNISIENQRRTIVALINEFGVPVFLLWTIDNYGTKRLISAGQNANISPGNSWSRTVPMDSHRPFRVATHEWADRLLFAVALTTKRGPNAKTSFGYPLPVFYCEYVKREDGKWVFSKLHDDPTKLDVDKWLKEPRLEPEKPKAEAAPN